MFKGSSNLFRKSYMQQKYASFVCCWKGCGDMAALLHEYEHALRALWCYRDQPKMPLVNKQAWLASYIWNWQGWINLWASNVLTNAVACSSQSSYGGDVTCADCMSWGVSASCHKCLTRMLKPLPNPMFLRLLIVGGPSIKTSSADLVETWKEENLMLLARSFTGKHQRWSCHVWPFLPS